MQGVLNLLVIKMHLNRSLIPQLVMMHHYLIVALITGYAAATKHIQNNFLLSLRLRSLKNLHKPVSVLSDLEEAVQTISVNFQNWRCAARRCLVSHAEVRTGATFSNFSRRLPFVIPETTISLTFHVNDQVQHDECPPEKLSGSCCPHGSTVSCSLNEARNLNPWKTSPAHYDSGITQSFSVSLQHASQ